MFKHKKLLMSLVVIILISCCGLFMMLNSNRLPGTYFNRPLEKDAKVVELNAPYINQRQYHAWNGCEAASLLEGFHDKGILLQTNLKTFLHQMPYSKNGNPNNGFSGSPYLKNQDHFSQSIYPKALTNWGDVYHHVKNISGASADTLKKQVQHKRPVVAYIISHYSETPQYQKYKWGKGIVNSHVVLLDGYERGYYHVSDPNRGKYWVRANLFNKAYGYKKYAVAIE